MSFGEKTLQPLPADDQMAFVPDDEMIVLELNQEFSYPWAGSADQVGEILMAGSYRQARATLVLDAEILGQLEQNQSQALFQCAAHEVCAAQLDQVPAAEIANGHPFEVVRRYPERDLDELF